MTNDILTFNKTMPTEQTVNLQYVLDNVDVLANLLRGIDSINTLSDGSTHIKFKKDMIIESVGHQVMYTKHGQHIQKSTLTHVNPDIDITDNVGDCDTRSVVVQAVESHKSKMKQLREISTVPIDTTIIETLTNVDIHTRSDHIKLTRTNVIK